MGRMKPKRRFTDVFGRRKKNETIIILVVSGQWSVVSGQWSVVSGQWNGYLIGKRNFSFLISDF